MKAVACLSFGRTPDNTEQARFPENKACSAPSGTSSQDRAAGLGLQDGPEQGQECCKDKEDSPGAFLPFLMPGSQLGAHLVAVNL